MKNILLKGIIERVAVECCLLEGFETCSMFTAGTEQVKTNPFSTGFWAIFQHQRSPVISTPKVFGSHFLIFHIPAFSYVTLYSTGTNLGAYGLQYCLAGFSADASPYGTLLTGMPGSQRSQGMHLNAILSPML